MKIKVKEDLRVGDKSYKKDDVIDAPEYPGSDAQTLAYLVKMGFAEEVKDIKEAKAKAGE